MQAGRAPLELDLESLLALLDGMLLREVAWYRGNFLAETLYTCLYLHDMERLKSNAILKVFCELTRSTCLQIISLVHRAGISEVRPRLSLLRLDSSPTRFVSFSSLTERHRSLGPQANEQRNERAAELTGELKWPYLGSSVFSPAFASRVGPWLVNCG